MTITIKYHDGIQITLCSVEAIIELPACQLSIKTYGNNSVIHRNVQSVTMTAFYRKDNS